MPYPHGGMPPEEDLRARDKTMRSIFGKNLTIEVDLSVGLSPRYSGEYCI